ncbi:MAG: ABC transporter permease [Treponema sp.]|nr:ABC transporter permease [Treponema sp.]
MAAVFFVLGMISPLTARFMPQIITWAMESDPTMRGMDFAALGFFTEPSAIDSWAQFFGNVGQMGLFVLVVVFAGFLSSEISNGTLTIILTKGLSRSSVILSKLTNAIFIWTISLGLAFATCQFYTFYLFPKNILQDLFFAVFCLWLLGVFLLTLTMLMAALTTKSYICMLAAGTVVIFLNIINIIPNVSRYNPVTLAGLPMQLLAETIKREHIYPTLAATAIGTAALTLFAIISFNKRKSGKKIL